MRKLLIISIVIFLVSIIYANDFMRPMNDKIPLELPKNIGKSYFGSREVPDYEFVTEPTEIMMNYYDYMPGSYWSIPAMIQPPISQPNGIEAGGVYILFHARETATSLREIYCSYFDSDGYLVSCTNISSGEYAGYGGIDIDPVTADPIVVWRTSLGIVGSFYTYHLGGGMNPWVTPFIIIDSDFYINNPDDLFVWPYIHIGPSPYPDKRRAYVIAHNAYSPGAYCGMNVVIAYADFNVDDLNSPSIGNWTYTSIPLLDQWNLGIPEGVISRLSMTVSDDGKVALMGYTHQDSIIVFYNDNYGEDDYEYFSEYYQFDIWNPQNLDGSYYFEEGGVPYTLYWSFMHSHHMNSIFSDGSNKINFCGSFGLQCYEGWYFPFWIYPKTFQFDIDTQEFSFNDLYITGLDPDDNIPMVPWDLNEDGVVDSYDPQGNVEHIHGWPIYFWDTNVAFHENNFKTTSNEDGSWLVNIWQDGLKSKYYNDWGDDDYIDWAEIAEVMISISNDGGATWSEPIIMNSLVGDENYVTQFDGMHPCYIYPSDEIEDLGGNWGLVHLFFLNDYSFGSWEHGFGTNDGGMMHYASIKINFEYVSTDDDTITPAVAQLSQNYPNPFNPATTIAYSLNEAGKVSIEVYNIKGQKVKELLIVTPSPDHTLTVTWDGTDENNQPVSSGVYLYKLSIDGKTKAVRKMMMIK
ncbi:MAG: T9SS type A sorting domain-containing protein [Candidatus Cloacimonetes bacterium]|nr:T9SS type A sorting domain-containing protein [Candidatus Cloacimonadota bacterium]